MNSLYNITNNFVTLMDKVVEGEITEEEYNQLGAELAVELKNKSVNIIGYVKNIEGFINAVKDEETRLEEMRKTAEKKLDKFKEYVKQNMETLEVSKIETDLGVLSVVKNPMSVEIENEDEIPTEFKKEVIKITPDKTAIKNHFKETGEIIPGTQIIDDKTSLRIK